MHGLGNDFIVINNTKLEYNLTPQQISFLADRKFGIGCDQLLIVEPSNDGISDFFYKIYNSDGSIAGQCGNGARCFTKYVIDNKLVNKDEVLMQTNNRIINGKQIDADTFSIDMGTPIFEPAQIPLALAKSTAYSFNYQDEAINFYALSMGNPHAVIILQEANKLSDDEYLANRAVALQTSGLFPEGVNVNFVVINNDNNISLRTYERGCGFTLACGSGACASAATTILLNQTNHATKVKMLGGELIIQWNQQDSLYMMGTATHVFDGTIEV
jgi:diaminopimelate epimerase